MQRVCFNKPFHDSIDSSLKTNGLNVGLNNIVFYPHVQSAVDVNHRVHRGPFLLPCIIRDSAADTAVALRGNY